MRKAGVIMEYALSFSIITGALMFGICAHRFIRAFWRD